jgi:hypothetical protein
MFSYLLRYLRKLFPDPRSQLACALVAALAFAGSVWWLVYTVQSKWIYGRDHPLQVVSYDAVQSLPSFFG